MKSWLPYSLAVYVGLMVSGILHRPANPTVDDSALSRTEAIPAYPHELYPQTWARPRNEGKEAVISSDQSHDPRGELLTKPRRNPFR